MPTPSDRVINLSQLGGIERYTLDDGPGRGVRALCINTGAGLRYRVLVDRGLDIDHAFFNAHSLTYLTHNSPVSPSRAYDPGLNWLQSFSAGLLTSCGPSSVGPPATDQNEQLGLHGTHSNTPASIESIIEPTLDNPVMSIVGNLRYGALYGPNLNLRRTISSRLGENKISIEDHFHNQSNTTVPHAWLLHINFGYPLLDEGSNLCIDCPTPQGVNADSETFFQGNWKHLTAPREDCRGEHSFVGYCTPRPTRPDGSTTVAILNPKLSLAVAIHYNTKEFPRLVNWQHLAPGEYVTALEPANGTVDGRDKDRANGRLDFIPAGATKTYRYELEVLHTPAQLQTLPRT
ncbi:MAG TPA: DUF4432 family protein [Tepidisphaeraceae bacterium]|jgi:hypothetical protein|nr:DUF4432 family protein [Tepidisphaeraceae bacterium]